MKNKLWWIACVLGSVAIAFLRMPQGIFNPAYMVGYIFGMIAMCFLVAGIAFVVSLLIHRKLKSAQFFNIALITFGIVLAFSFMGATLR